MNYDKVIVELLVRIKDLEEKVEFLLARQQFPEYPNLDYPTKAKTGVIFDYINEQKEIAKKAGEKFLTLKAGDIHKANNFKNSMPIVCNAMRKCMGERDVVVFQTPSGYSSTLEIKYDLEDEE